MLVSICMISYNQEQYIGAAIESIVSQQTNFEFELIISDDYSVDGTLAIAQKYQSLYPNIIKLLLHEENIGMMPNFISALKACTGKYVAICEGDDYWIDPSKLQKQAGFLEANLDYSICFCRVYEKIGDKKILSPDNPWEEEKTFTIYDLAAGNFIHTPSVMFRNGLFKSLPSWFHKSPVGDYPLHLFNAREGLIKYLNEPMVVYRKFVGTWSSQPHVKIVGNFIKVLDYLLMEPFSSSVKVALKAQKRRLVSEYCEMLFKNNDSSYLEVMKSELLDEADFISRWIFSLLNSKSYKMAFKISTVLSKLRAKSE